MILLQLSIRYNIKSMLILSNPIRRKMHLFFKKQFNVDEVGKNL